MAWACVDKGEYIVTKFLWPQHWEEEVDHVSSQPTEFKKVFGPHGNMKNQDQATHMSQL